MYSSLRATVVRPAALQVRNKSVGQLAKKTKTLGVILTKKMDGIGEEGEELTVKRGFARNYLFPKSAAVYATPEAKRQYADAAARIDYLERARQKALESAQKRLAKLTLKIKRQRMDEDKLHAPVNSETISAQLWRQYRIDIAPNQIVFPEEEAITSWGSHQVKIKVGHSGTADLGIQVVMR